MVILPIIINIISIRLRIILIVFVLCSIVVRLCSDYVPTMFLFCSCHVPIMFLSCSYSVSNTLDYVILMGLIRVFYVAIPLLRYC